LNAYNPQQVTSDKPKAEEKERARKLLAATLENSGSVLVQKKSNSESFTKNLGKPRSLLRYLDHKLFG
jgi:hypothetical protein